MQGGGGEGNMAVFPLLFQAWLIKSSNNSMKKILSQAQYDIPSHSKSPTTLDNKKKQSLNMSISLCYQPKSQIPIIEKGEGLPPTNP